MEALAASTLPRAGARSARPYYGLSGHAMQGLYGRGLRLQPSGSQTGRGKQTSQENGTFPYKHDDMAMLQEIDPRLDLLAGSALLFCPPEEQRRVARVLQHRLETPSHRRAPHSPRQRQRGPPPVHNTLRSDFLNAPTQINRSRLNMLQHNLQALHEPQRRVAHRYLTADAKQGDHAAVCARRTR